jgi:hypothetical protein
MPMFPWRMGMAHFSPRGQQTCVLPLLQHERLFGQQPALPQQRVVRLSQHLRRHSSWFGAQRLQRPVEGLAQRQLVGQHFEGPHRARPCGQRFAQTVCDEVPNRARRHSSFGSQQTRPHASCPFLQHSPRFRLPQNWSDLQHAGPHGFAHSHARSPIAGLPQRMSDGQHAFSHGAPPEPLGGNLQQMSSGLQQSR